MGKHIVCYDKICAAICGMKFYSKSTWSNVSAYGKLILLIALVFGDKFLMTSVQDLTKQAHPRLGNVFEQGQEQEQERTLKR